MHFTKKTYYGLGIVASACNLAGSVLLMAGVGAGFLYQLASIASTGMMLFLAAKHTQNNYKYTALAAALLGVGGMVPGAVGAVLGALAWPVFAVPYFMEAQPETPRRTVTSLVFVTGVVQLAGSFLPMPDMLRICLAIFIALTQGVLAWVLFQEEKAA